MRRRFKNACWRVALVCILLGAFAAPGRAQGLGVYSGFFVVKRAPDIYAAPASQSVPFNLASGTTATTVWVCNAGIALVFVALGNAPLTADPAAALPIQPGRCVNLQAAGMLYIAAVTQPGETETPLVTTVLGNGNP